MKRANNEVSEEARSVCPSPQDGDINTLHAIHVREAGFDLKKVLLEMSKFLKEKCMPLDLNYYFSILFFLVLTVQFTQ